jgi:hypothetical protein
LPPQELLLELELEPELLLELEEELLEPDDELEPDELEAFLGCSRAPRPSASASPICRNPASTPPVWPSTVESPAVKSGA